MIIVNVGSIMKCNTLENERDYAILTNKKKDYYMREGRQAFDEKQWTERCKDKKDARKTKY